MVQSLFVFANRTVSHADRAGKIEVDSGFHEASQTVAGRNIASLAVGTANHAFVVRGVSILAIQTLFQALSSSVGQEVISSVVRSAGVTFKV